MQCMNATLFGVKFFLSCVFPNTNRCLVVCERAAKSKVLVILIIQPSPRHISPINFCSLCHFIIYNKSNHHYVHNLQKKYGFIGLIQNMCTILQHIS